jgi:hypothetical protein
MQVRINAVDTAGVETARAAFQTVDLVPFLKKQLRQI